MSINCRIDVDGKVSAPNGKPSLLYKNLEERFGKDKALELYSISETVEYKDALFLDVDSNGEMTSSNFLKFVYEANQNKDYTFETLDLQHRNTPQELQKLKRVFEQGIFSPTYSNLKSTGIFTEDEIVEIMYSQEKQQNLKAFVEGLETQENVSPVENFKEYSETYNDIGIKSVKDPSLVKEDVLTILSEANTVSEVQKLINDLPYQGIIDRFNSDEVFRRDLTKLALDSHIIPVEQDNTKLVDTLINTVDVSQLDEVEASTNRIQEMQDKDLIIEEYDSLQDSLINAGLDLQIEEYDLSTKSLQELKDFSNTLNTFVTEMNFSNTVKLAETIENFVPQQNQKLVLLPNYNRPTSTLRYLDTKKSEIDNFNDKSLVKISDNVYQKVKNTYDLDILYQTLLKKSERDGSELTIDELRDMVQEKADTLPKSDMETKEKIIIYKMLYNIPINYPSNKVSSNSVSDVDYISNQFVSDFNKERLKNKKENTPAYNNFYRFFTVDHKGIRPVNNSVYTQDFIRTGMTNEIEGISAKLKTDLIDYMKLSKYPGSFPIIENIDIVDSSRIMAQQDPYSVPKAEGNYQIVSETEILAYSDGRQFLRVEDQVYEKVLEYDDIQLYKALPKGDSVLKSTNTEKPVSDKTVDYLREYKKEVDRNIITNKYLSAQKLEEFNEKYFDC